MTRIRAGSAEEEADYPDVASAKDSTWADAHILDAVAPGVRAGVGAQGRIVVADPCAESYSKRVGRQQHHL